MECQRIYFADDERRKTNNVHNVKKSSRTTAELLSPILTGTCMKHEGRLHIDVQQVTVSNIGDPCNQPLSKISVESTHMTPRLQFCRHEAEAMNAHSRASGESMIVELHHARTYKSRSIDFISHIRHQKFVGPRDVFDCVRP